MSTDPAFLFYPGDWLGGTLGMSFEEKGAYMEVLMLQFNRGHMEGHMIGQAVGQIWDKIRHKFIQDDKGLWYNVRLEKEKNKRKSFTDSRKNNLNGNNQYSKNGAHKDGHMSTHMEDENTIDSYINKRRVIFENLPEQSKTKLLRKYDIDNPIVWSGKKIPVQHHDLVEFIVNAMDSAEWKINLKSRFGELRFESALIDFVKTLKINYEYQNYNSENDFRKHFSNWLIKAQSKY